MEVLPPVNVPVLSDTLASICSYMEQQQDLRLEHIASHFHYSPEHLSRKFHAETGESFRSWCDKLKARRAAMLLCDQKRSIADIAEYLRYSNESSFIRAFKRLYGIPPAAFRQRREAMREMPISNAEKP